jgi:cytochrome c biogenesis protein CcmG/thiol:disulfide interchange protein DsbE
VKLIGALGVVGVLVALFWFGFSRDPSNVPDPLVGRTAPLFTLKSTSGQTIALRQLRGRPVVISFFASWCVSCKQEEGNLVNAYQRWHGRATFLGLIYEDSPSKAAEFTRSFGGRWQDLVDPHDDTALNYGISGIPTTFFVNAAGVVKGYTVSLTPVSLNAGIRAALPG